MKKDICSIYFFDEQVNKMPAELRYLAKENSYAYSFNKAAIFLTIGAEKYRFDDYFHQPSEDMNIPHLITGSSQIVYKCRGLTAETCICDLPEHSFVDLMKMFHFEIIAEEYDDSSKDKVIMKGKFRHIVTYNRTMLWCRIKG